MLHNGQPFPQALVAERRSCSRLYGDRVERAPPHTYDDPKHWCDRAAEMRGLADGVANVEARRMMLELADDYDKLADRAAKRQMNHAKHFTPMFVGLARP